MSLRGDIQTMPLTDLLQWLEIMQKTGVLEIIHAQTEQKFYLSQGMIATATSSHYYMTDSVENVRRILAETMQWPTGRFTFAEGSLPEEITAINFRIDMQSLLLDVCREMDEAAEAARRLGVAAGAEQSRTTTLVIAKSFRLAVIDRLLQNKYELPLLPDVVNRILEVTRQGDYSLRSLSNVINTDPLLTAQVLKHANSALYAGTREVNSLPQAVQRLGAQAVVNIVLAVSLQSVRSTRDIFLARKNQLWQYSLSTALVAQMVAIPAAQDRDIAFLCGLMMDFGKTVLLSMIQDVMTQDPVWQRTPADLVDRLLDSYHAKVGGLIAEKWHLPAPVREAIACHHVLKGAHEHRAYAAIASLSDTLATHFASSASTETEEQIAQRQSNQSLTITAEAEELAKLPASEALGFSPSQIQLILDRGPECLKFVREFLVK
jgi:HD-like signal output (HDOD) protein